MKTQSDSKTRVVTVENLRAMCEHVSGMCHNYWIESVSRSRVKVGYSNPNEYGSDNPIFAVFPCYPSTFDGNENPSVVLEYLRVIESNDPSLAGEGWQSFEILRDCPIMFRGPEGKWTAYSLNPDNKSVRPYVAMDAKCKCGHNVYQHAGDGCHAPEKCHAFINDEFQNGCGCTQFEEA